MQILGKLMLLTFGNAGSDEFNFSHLAKLTTTESEEGTAKHLEKNFCDLCIQPERVLGELDGFWGGKGLGDRFCDSILGHYLGLWCSVACGPDNHTLGLLVGCCWLMGLAVPLCRVKVVSTLVE